MPMEYESIAIVAGYSKRKFVYLNKKVYLCAIVTVTQLSEVVK